MSRNASNLLLSESSRRKLRLHAALTGKTMSRIVDELVGGLKEVNVEGVAKPVNAPEGWVYFIRNPDTGYIKIGHSKNPERRLSDLQGGSSGQLEKIGSYPAPKSEEGHLHNRFARQNVNGEWYRPGRNLTAFIKKVVV